MATTCEAFARPAWKIVAENENENEKQDGKLNGVDKWFVLWKNVTKYFEKDIEFIFCLMIMGC